MSDDIPSSSGREPRPRDMYLERTGSRPLLDHSEKEIDDEVSGIIRDEVALLKNWHDIRGRSNKGMAEEHFIHQRAGSSQVNFEKADTWSTCFEKILSFVGSRDTGIAEICVISTDTTRLQRAFPFMHRLIPREQRLAASSTPQEIVMKILQDRWKLADNILSAATQCAAEEPGLPTRKLCLPSAVSRDISEDKTQTYATFGLQWIDCPHFASDLGIYVFRPHGKHPKIEHLNVTFSNSELSRARKAMVMIGSNDLFAKLRQGDTYLLDSCLACPDHDSPELIYALNIFQKLLSEVVSQLALFLENACEEINYMIYEGRLHPSGSKIEFLRHMEDCHSVARECLSRNSSSTQRFIDQIDSTRTPHTEAVTSMRSSISLFLEDLEYLEHEIEISLQRLPPTRRIIREHMDLAQAHRTTILGILAGLYLPLSFVTSFLGMNVDKYTPEPHWHNVTHYEPGNKNSTSVSQIFDSSENQSWGLATFFEIAVPLVVGTILLPLIIGSMIRAFLQTLTRGKTWWRFGFALMVIAYSVFSALWASWWCFFFFGYGLAFPFYVPFWIFALFNISAWAFNRSFKLSIAENVQCLIYWIYVTGFPLLIVFGGIEISYRDLSTWPVFLARINVFAVFMGLIYGISFFVALRWRPIFFYHWEERQGIKKRGNQRQSTNTIISSPI